MSQDWKPPKLSQYRNIISKSSSWGNTSHLDDIYDLPKLSNPDNESDSKTYLDQTNTENKCKDFLRSWLLSDDQITSAGLDRRKTIQYLCNGIESLSSGYLSQDCSRPWICYWIINSLNMLNALNYINKKIINNVIKFLKKCQDNNIGGYAGGPLQYGHIATSYGAIMCLLSIGSKEAYDSIDRELFYKFLMKMKQNDGSFSCHENGEIDIRAVYCGLSCAAIIGIMDDELVKGTVKWLESCQTYQGGFAQEPFDEAHGGYAFCGVASLVIIKAFLNKKYNIDVNSLIRWQTYKQMSYSGGFQGRTNKLVDACYSFWVGAVFPMINIIKIQTINNNTTIIKENINEIKNEDGDENKDSDNDNEYNNNNNKLSEIEMILNMDTIKSNIKLYDEMELQKYILIIAQNINGGISDKPPKPADYYHTCYGLNGLSIAQQQSNKILGPSTNMLTKVNPVFGITCDKLRDAYKYFKNKPFKKPK